MAVPVPAGRRGKRRSLNQLLGACVEGWCDGECRDHLRGSSAGMGLLAGLSAASPRGARPINCIAWPIFWRRYGAAMMEKKQRYAWFETEVYDGMRWDERDERREKRKEVGNTDRQAPTLVVVEVLPLYSLEWESNGGGISYSLGTNVR